LEDWDFICSNPNAIDLIKKNMDKVSWYYLSQNPNAIDLLKLHEDKIDWSGLCLNPNVLNFICDYQEMKINTLNLLNELSILIFNPVNFHKICEKYGMNFIDVLDIY